MKKRNDELHERAEKLLGVYGRPFATSETIRQNYLRQARLVHPDVNFDKNSEEIMTLITQAYHFLVADKKISVDALKNDKLVSSLIGKVTPIEKTETKEGWNARRFYDSGRNSIWPVSERQKEEMKYKFKGL
ncbi:MAG: J domain-containing protein [Verrucomicrobiota bacterium]|nr:J domain-containing protein [Verrucomicrobiota bacterium]